MSESKYSSVWDSVYRGDVQSLPWVACHCNETVCEFIWRHVSDKPKTILDVGCGTGGLANELSQRFLNAKVHAIDVSQEAINTCNKNFPDSRVTYVQGDILDGRLGLSTTKYDVVVAHFLLHEIDSADIEAACHKISSHVKDGGYLYLSWLIQDTDCEAKVRPGLYSQVTPYKVTYYSTDEIVRYFSEIDLCDIGKKKLDLTSSPQILKDAQRNKVNGFTYRVMWGRKIAGRIGRGVQVDSRQKAIAQIRDTQDATEICNQIANSIFSWFNSIDGFNYNVYINFQLGNSASDLISKQSFFSSEKQHGSCMTRAGFLVQYFRRYEVETGGKKKFLAHDFFRTHAAKSNYCNWIRRVVFFLNPLNGDVGVKVNDGSQDRPTCTVKEFFESFGIDSSYDWKSYYDYISAVLGVVDEGENPFVRFVGREALKSYPPLYSYTIYNLSIPGFDYIGSVIIESWKGALRLDRDARDSIKDLVYVAKLVIGHRRFQVKSITSAIGSIMSRNGSHNIGSHVLSDLSHNVGTMPDDRVLYQYIQNRMDYIATATTDFPKWTYTTKFVGGMIKEFLSQRHLLDYISRSEGLCAFRFQDHNSCDEGWADQKGTIRLHVSRFGQGVPDGKTVAFLEYPDGSSAARETLIKQARDNQQFDLDIAIPGGVIGQHAFFTIIENVIRNAAKHGWATLRKECRCGSKDHLDICVNFKLEQDCRNVLVRVSDNISDVFAVPELKQESLSRRYARIVCQKWGRDHWEWLRRPLSFADFKLLREFLSGRGGILPENLPDPYADLYQRLQQLQEEEGDGSIPVWKGIPDVLRGSVDPKNPDALGYRLWLPLHHSQQMILAEKFIGEDGALRREHWGLAEMKISAGFLQMRSIEDIGGLNEMVNDCRWDNKDALLIPCCDPDNHLEYQFRIRCPREVAFVVRQSELKGRAVSSGTFIALQKLGVYVVVVPDGDEPGEKADEAYDRAFKSGEKESLSWDYRYVVLPKFPDLDDPQLPFRIVLGSECVTEGSRPSVINNLSKVEEKFYHRAKRDILSIDNPSEGAVSPSIFELASEIKTHVFLAWNVYWREKRRCDIDIERPLRLCLDVNHSSTGDTQSSKKSAERCLISDADVWKTVFCELFRSYARRMIQKNLSPYKQTEVKGYLALLAVADKRSYGGFDNVAPRASMMKTLYDWMVPVLNVEDEKEWNVWLDRHQAPLQEFWRSCECEWAACRKYSVDFKDREVRQRLIAFHQDIHRWIEDCASHPGLQYGVPTIVYDGRPMEYPGLSVAMACLEDVFEYVNVLLRKYEERIVTLPESFKPQKTGDGMRMKAGRVAVDHANQVGVVLELEDCSLEDTDVVRLNYIRHYACSDNDSASKMAYAEPLSGTQTYLNTLSALVNCSDASQKGANQRLISLLYENALARILIIDERTVDFVKEHRDAAACFSRMGIWVYDHETWDKKSYNDQEKGLWHDAGQLPMKKTLLGEDEIGLAHMLLNDAPDSNKEGLKAFDALIIHQGLIDKWLPTQAQSRSSMETLLANLRRHVPYVLITTGRGTPANTPNTARILPFSVIEKTLFRQSPEKLILMDTIMSVLPIGVRK